MKDVRDHGAHPILVTPVSRRTFDKDGKAIYHSQGDFAMAVRKLAEEEKVPLLDLEARTSEELEKMGPEISMAWFMWVPPGELAAFPEGHKDDTHFNAYGAWTASATSRCSRSRRPPPISRNGSRKDGSIP